MTSGFSRMSFVLFLLFVCLRTWAQVTLPFTDDFTGSTLNPAWQVLPGQGGYSVGGGRLRYYNAGPVASTTGWINPALTLSLPFTGTNWKIEIKATYSLQWCPPGQTYTGPPVPSPSCTSGAQGPEVLVKFAPGTTGTNYAGRDYTGIQRIIDAYYGADSLSASYGAVSNSALLNPSDATIQNNIADGTYWYQITRNGGTLIIKYSYDGSNYATAFSAPLSNPSSSYNELLIGGITYSSAGSYTDYNYVHITGGCQVSPSEFDLGTANQGTEIFARFTPADGLAAAMARCGVDRFNFTNKVLVDPHPPISGITRAIMTPPYSDPPLGGYWNPFTQTTYADGRYPFYYSLADFLSGCYVFGPLCLPIVSSTTLTFSDTPQDVLLNPLTQNIGFETHLVGVHSIDDSTVDLLSFTWDDNFNGRVGGVGNIQLRSNFAIPADPKSGIGGITITSVNGVPVNTVIVGPGLCVPFPVALPSPAGPNGASMTLSSSDPSRVVFAPGNESSAQVFIPAGSTTPDRRMPEVCGVNFGSATITVASGVYSSITTVQVTATLNFSPASVMMTTAKQSRLTLSLSAPAPAGGLTVSLSSDNVGVATVPASVTIPGGDTAVTVSVTGVAVGSTVIHATAPPVVPDTSASVKVQ